MAITANQVRIQQYGDAVVGEKVERVYDHRTGLIGEKTTTVAQLPMEGGGTAIVVGEQVKVAQVAPPNYSPRGGRAAIQYDEPSSDKNKGTLMFCLWSVCGCFIFAVSLAMIISVSAVGLVTCPPLSGVGITGIILGVLTLLMSCVCCCCVCNKDTLLSQCAFCLTISLLLLLFFTTLIPNTVFVAQNMDVIVSNNVMNVTCNAPVTSLAVMSMSYVLLLIFTTFCLCAACSCLFQAVKSDSETL